MARTDWLPTRLADQATVFENIAAKIGAYTTTLPLTTAQVTAIQLICAEFDAAYAYTEQFRAVALATVGWRDSIFKGTPTGAAAGGPPAVPTLDLPAGAKIGILQQFREYRDIILAAPGYTDSIGQDLMIVGSGSSGPSVPAADAVPDLKCHVGSGYEVTIAGAMHGMDAMRIEWQPNGGSAPWSLVGFLTKTPGNVIISPPTPGQPVAGRIRARYIHNNLPVGEYSPEYAVTVSQ